ncbi:hypothetical protein BDZ45DRAFT_598819 [Acephala macrosclerotiorum]|nr:hypothetical protein BDZ45DRAFT_598819 [Acephala macrosclerotiorum]
MKILSGLCIYPYFTEAVVEFGFRTKANDDLCNHFHWRGSGEQSEIAEMSYIIRFFERNTWGEGNPWSLRQTAIYHRLHIQSADGSWIVVKPSPIFQRLLKEKLEALYSKGNPASYRHITIHVLALYFTLGNWREFLADHTSKLSQIEDKAIFSHADQDYKNDYRVVFEDRQEVQELRQTLIQASTLAKTSIDLSTRIALFWGRLRTGQPNDIQETIDQELEDYQAEMRYNERCVKNLLTRSSEAASMLVSILEHRLENSSLRSAMANEASLSASKETLQASQTSLATLKNIAVQGRLEQSIEQESSSNVRALTVVATLYLPATLLVGILSSNLVHVSAGKLVVSAEFWKYIVVLLAMVIVTIGLVIIIQKLSEWNYKRKLEGLAFINTI